MPRLVPGAWHLRRMLEDLGPTFMKLGQVLSTRPDLIPPAYDESWRPPGLGADRPIPGINLAVEHSARLFAA